MKRILCLALTCVLLSACLVIVPSAGTFQLPFELTAPAYLSASWLEENDSPTTTALSFNLSNAMTQFFKEWNESFLYETHDELLERLGCEDFWLTAQIDWALDDVNDSVSGWHYNSYWDGDSYYGFGVDEDGYHHYSDWDGVDYGLGNGEETTQEYWVTRGLPAWLWDGPEDQVGVKSQVKPGQVTYDYDEEVARIDYTKHTMYYRARLVACVYIDGETTYYHSGWSNIAAVGKDAVQYKPLKAGDLPKPIITDLRMTDKEFNGQPVIAYTQTVPDSLMEMASSVSAHGGSIYVETYMRVVGDSEWTLMGNADWEIRAGEMEVCLITLCSDERPNITSDMDFELRTRYACYQKDVDEDIYSAYSDIITLPKNYKLGDVNLDGTINAKDYVILKRNVLTGFPQLNSLQLLAADVTLDKTINAKDYVKLKRYVLGTATLG